MIATRVGPAEGKNKRSEIAKVTDPVLVVIAVAEVSAVVVVAIVLGRIPILEAVVADIPDTIDIEIRLIGVRNLRAVVVRVGNTVAIAIGNDRKRGVAALGLAGVVLSVSLDRER
jgi:hypothetical protein